MNKKTQSAIGVARAIAYYAEKKMPVYIPVTDISRNDIVVDNGDKLLKVEVKTTSQKNGAVTLRTSGGNQSWRRESKYLSADDCDLVYITNINTGSEKEFLISDIAGRNSVTLK